MMLGARTAMWGLKKIPWDYRCDYISSTGVQWADTGLYTPCNTDIEKLWSAEFEIIFRSSSGRKLTFANSFGFFGHTSTNIEMPTPIAYYFGNTQVGLKRTVFIEVTQKSSDISLVGSVDGNQIQRVKSDVFSNNRQKIFIGTIGTKENPETSFAMTASFYKLTIAGYDGTVKNFIPCVKNGRASFYCPETKEFHFSTSGTDFVNDGHRVNDDGTAIE